MKSIFKVHPLTYGILFTVLASGYFNYFLIIAFILTIHDLGHIICLKLFNYQISKISVLPFGSIIDTNINPSAKTSEVFLISVAGILMQLILYPVMSALNSAGIINHISYHIFLNYNKIILLFNLLPIIPLDGSKIMMSLFESFFSYKMALKLVNISSLGGIVFFLCYMAYEGLNSYLIVAFLCYKTWEVIKNHAYFFNSFLVSRLSKKTHYSRIKYVFSIKSIHKNKYNFINNENEDKVLSNYFRL